MFRYHKYKLSITIMTISIQLYPQFKLLLTLRNYVDNERNQARDESTKAFNERIAHDQQLACNIDMRLRELAKRALVECDVQVPANTFLQRA